jgi:CheY-like chemotaxis protein
LAFASKQTVAPKVLDLNDTVEGMLKILRRLIGENIALAWKPGHGLWPIRIDPTQIDQMLANLCANARDAISGTGKVTIETSNASFDEDDCANHADFIPGDYVLLAVSDNGCGMSPESIDHLFEPFFTTKEIGKGTGLGLASLYGAIKQNNGFINVYSEPDKGTTFKIYLPRDTTKRQPEAKEPRPQIERGSETILLVEDEPAILRMTGIILEKLGYNVLAASSPSEALRLAREHTGKIHLLLTDVIMPEMQGYELAQALLSLDPAMKCLFMSGYTAHSITRSDLLAKDIHFIQKPFSKADLGAKLRVLLKS